MYRSYDSGVKPPQSEALRVSARDSRTARGEGRSKLRLYESLLPAHFLDRRGGAGAVHAIEHGGNVLVDDAFPAAAHDHGYHQRLHALEAGMRKLEPRAFRHRFELDGEHVSIGPPFQV
ncbi:MAG: hypothetical protein ACRD5G_11920 [Candidatus Acidiferrales bacterium]